MGHDAAAPAAPEAEPRLLRIQEVAAETGLTPRSIRYYEEMGLLAPAARSEGAYRLYDADDLERLRFIGGLRNDAGFSLAEIGQMLEDEQARSRNRVQFRAGAPDDQRAALTDAIDRIDRQLATLARKRDRLESMIADAAARRAHLRDHLADLEAGRSPDHAPHAGAPWPGPELDADAETETHAGAPLPRTEVAR
ncbi:MAG TPA: MerR family transcriptional regulator [Candidatus Limnocylindrales bacterium]